MPRTTEQGLKFEEALQKLRENKETDIDMDGCHLGEEDFLVISEALRRNTAVTNLRLSNNRLTSFSADYLSRALLANTSLKYLFLNSTELDSEGLSFISNALLVNRTLSSLMMEENHIDDVGVSSLIHTLSHNEAVTFIGLKSNPVNASHKQKLEVLVEANFKKSQSRMTPGFIIQEPSWEEMEPIKQAIEALRNNTEESVVIEYDNKDIKLELTDAEFIQITEALANNTSVKRFVLKGVHCSEQHAELLGLALKRNSSVGELHIEGTGLKPGGMRHISRALYQNPTIHSLTLAHNRIGEEGAQSLIEAIAHNSVLTQVVLQERVSKLSLAKLNALVAFNDPAAPKRQGMYAQDRRYKLNYFDKGESAGAAAGGEALLDESDCMLGQDPT